MARLREECAKAKGTPTSSYARMLDEHEKERMLHKIEICYMLARGLVFLKYRVFCVPAEWQGVEVGSSYKTNDSARLFTR